MSEVTRSTDATSAPAVAYVDRRRRSMPTGWWGAVLFVATEATLFGTLIASYFYLRSIATHWPPAGTPLPKVALPLVLTGALLAMSVPIWLATRAARAGRRLAAIRLFALALLVQCAYLGVQVHLYLSDLDKFSPRDSAYGSVYFTLGALHHLHVLIGILLSVWAIARLASGLTTYRLTAVRAIGLYWHFVNAVAILVILTQLSPSL